MRRTLSIMLVVLAVAVVAVAGYVVVHADPVKDAGTVPSPPPGAESTTAGPSPTGSSSSSSSAIKTVAFLGDNWTAGAEASKDAKRFTTLVASSLDLTEKNFGASGTGYSQGTDSAGSYLSRVQKVIDAKPDVVVVSGGRNDVDANSVESRTKELFKKLRNGLPNAKLVALAPMWGDSDKPDELRAISDDVKRAVTAVDGTYLDIADPIHNHPNYMATDSNPNDRGYAAIASAVTDALRKVVRD